MRFNNDLDKAPAHIFRHAVLEETEWNAAGKEPSINTNGLFQLRAYPRLVLGTVVCYTIPYTSTT